MKYQGFCKTSKQNTKSIFLLNNSTQLFLFPCLARCFPLNVLYSSFKRHSSTKDFIYSRCANGCHQFYDIRKAVFPEPLVSTADQTKRGLWGRECGRFYIKCAQFFYMTRMPDFSTSTRSNHVTYLIIACCSQKKKKKQESLVLVMTVSMLVDYVHILCGYLTI